MAQRNNQLSNRHDLEVRFGKISIENGLIKVPTTARVLLRNVPVVGTQVMFQEGINLPPSSAIVKTSDSGFALYTYEFPISRAKEAVNLSMPLFSFGDRASFDVTLPEDPNGNQNTVRTNIGDPDDLFLFAYTDNETGNACVDITLKDELGNGLEGKTVQFFIQDPPCLFPLPGGTPPVPQVSPLPPSTKLPYHEVITDEHGSAIFLFPRQLQPGENIRLTGKISGIPGEGCDIVVSRSVPKVVRQSLFDRVFDAIFDWIRTAKTRVNNNGVVVNRNWFIRLMLTIVSIPFYIVAFIIDFLGINSNNGRARLGWIAVPFVLAYCVYIGIGDISFNPNGEHWQKVWWTCWFFGTIFVLPIYTIVAMREELSELWASSVHALRRKHRGSIHDSYFERLMEMGGQVMSVGRAKRSAVTVDPSGAAAVNAAPNPHSNVGMGSMFISGIGAEFAWDFLSKAFVRIIKGK